MLKPNDWPDGICACFNDMGICCKGCYCPCCLSRDNFLIIDNPENTCKGGCGTKMTEFWIRQTIRRRSNMREECCNDCLLACCCCTQLAICQDARALQNGYGLPMPGEGYFGRITNPSTKQQSYSPPPQQNIPLPPQQPQQGYPAYPSYPDAPQAYQAPMYAPQQGQPPMYAPQPGQAPIYVQQQPQYPMYSQPPQ